MVRVASALLLVVLASCTSDTATTTSNAVTTRPVTATTSTAPVTTTTAGGPTTTGARSTTREVVEFPVTPGSRPHDVAPAADGKSVWYTGQGNGTLGLLDPSSGAVTDVPLGAGSAPHGVIVGPDGAPWVTDGGLNAIVRVEPATLSVQAFPLPASAPGANLNTATFDGDGVLWFTGQAGYYGRLDPGPEGGAQVFEAPRGRGPYGIATTPSGDVWYASLAGSHIARIDRATNAATPVDPPTADQGARRVWADSQDRIWVSEFNAGQVARHDPASGEWKEWRLPGANPQPYSVYVDDRDRVWLTDFGDDTIVLFEPDTEQFTTIALPTTPARIRQMLGRPGEAWGALSASDRLVVVRG